MYTENVLKTYVRYPTTTINLINFFFFFFKLIFLRPQDGVWSGTKRMNE